MIKKKRVNFCLSDNAMEILRDLAAKKGVSMSGVLEMMLRDKVTK